MKKLIAMLMVLVMVLSFAACANNNDVQDDTTNDTTNNDTTNNENNDTNEGDTNEGDTNEGDTNEGDTNEGDTNEGDTNEGDTNEPENNETETTDGALDILNNIWAQYGDDEKFPVMGGNPEGGVMDGPAVWDAELLANLEYTTNISADQLANVADAATMIHMMNANTFTSVVYHLNEGVDAAAFAQAARDSVQSAQWMCGFPEKLIVAAIGDCVLVAYGVNDAMTPFEGHLTAAYADAQILFNEAIAG